MAATAFTDIALLNVKQALSECFPNEKSSHLTEALAAACGYRTHAALLTDLKQSNAVDPAYILLDDEVFIRRLHEMNGEPIPKGEDFDWFEHLPYTSRDSVVRTKSSKWYQIKYTSLRHRAWRNLMISGINAGIEQSLFTIKPDDNRWPNAKGHGSGSRAPAHVFRFSVDDIPAIGSVSDAGWDELSIHVAFWPTDKAETWIRVADSEFMAGEACAFGWLERQEGAWLQTAPKPSIACRKKHLERVAALNIQPKGFADRGNFKM